MIIFSSLYAGWWWRWICPWICNSFILEGRIFDAFNILYGNSSCSLLSFSRYIVSTQSSYYVYDDVIRLHLIQRAQGPAACSNCNWMLILLCVSWSLDLLYLLGRTILLPVWFRLLLLVVVLLRVSTPPYDCILCSQTEVLLRLSINMVVNVSVYDRWNRWLHLCSYVDQQGKKSKTTSLQESMNKRTFSFFYIEAKSEKEMKWREKNVPFLRLFSKCLSVPLQTTRSMDALKEAKRRHERERREENGFVYSVIWTRSRLRMSNSCLF